MGLVEATRTCLRKYAGFTGRARRAEFWWFELAALLISAVLVVPAVVLFLIGVAGASTSDSGEITAGGGTAVIVAFILYGLAGLVSLALTLPIIAATARRLHDTDRSGWWCLLTLVPAGGIVVLVFCALDGTPGPNRFGPSPKGLAPYGDGATGGVDQGYGHPAQA